MCSCMEIDGSLLGQSACSYHRLNPKKNLFCSFARVCTSKKFAQQSDESEDDEKQVNYFILHIISSCLNVNYIFIGKIRWFLFGLIESMLFVYTVLLLEFVKWVLIFQFDVLIDDSIHLTSFFLQLWDGYLSTYQYFPMSHD